MSLRDVVAFAFTALQGHRLRTLLSMLGVSIGIAAVVILTALGEGARRYVVGQFAALGTNLLIVVPGKTETSGALPGVGGIPHDLTLEDAEAIRRSIGAVRLVSPATMATERVSHGERRRQVPVLGATREFAEIRRLRLAEGEFLPPSEWDRGAPIAVLGHRVARELFPGGRPVGQVVRVGSHRLRVIGVIARQGMSMGFDIDELVFVPVATGLRIFNRSSLFRIFVEVGSREDLEVVRARVLSLLTERHREEDVTVLTQESVVATFSILAALTLALSAIAAVSLVVAGVGIMNVMLVSVAERTAEVGLLRALGARRAQVLAVFLAEAVWLSVAGGLVGLAAGIGAVRVLVRLYPALPASPPVWAVGSALLVSLVTGVLFGVWPARRATRLDPVAALGAEVTVEARDLLWLAFGALRGNRLRSALSMLGIAIGIAAVMLLTSIGEGTRRYILGQFTQFGTNLLAINPGRTETFGIPGVLGGTTHKLTIDDAEAIARLSGVQTVMPVVVGKARVEGNGRARSVLVYGVTAAVPQVWKVELGQGSFLPASDPRRGRPVVALGAKLKRELYGDESPLLSYVRIGGSRFQVIGVMATKGRLLGFDIDDTAYLPVASAMRLFNLDELLEIDVLFSHGGLTSEIERAVSQLLVERHEGNEDFTITTQTEMLEVFGNVMDVITMAVGAIAAVSLLVGAIGILTIMWIAVGERTAEIGLARAVGATSGQVLAWFLAEAAALALTGGAAGVGAGVGAAALLRALVPALPVETPLRYVIAAVASSLAVGLASGVLPARRAARLDPIEALRSE